MLSPMPMERPKVLYHTRRLAVKPAPVRVPTNSYLSLVSCRLDRKLFRSPSGVFYIYIAEVFLRSYAQKPKYAIMSFVTTIPSYHDM